MLTPEMKKEVFMILGSLNQDIHTSNDILQEYDGGFKRVFSTRGEEIEDTLDFIDVLIQFLTDIRKENDMALVKSFPESHKADHIRRKDGRVVKVKQGQKQSGIDESRIKRENPELFHKLEQEYPRVSRRGTVERPANLSDEVDL